MSVLNWININFDNKLILSILMTLFVVTQKRVHGIQCFSCKGTGINELLANNNCLENGYLENCDDFYDYYTKVDDKKVLTDYYYEEYYDDNTADNIKVDAAGTNKRQKRQAKNASDKSTNGSTEYEYEYYEYYVDEDKTKKEEKLDDDDKSKNSKVSDNISKTDKEEKEAENEEDSDDESVIPESSKNNLPRDPKHHCYSATQKMEWEHYAVEKGCKKITYCKMDEANKPDWSNPWNFCCEKSRCNAKIVKDKPQRIYGMPCRRTDDCIQGHTSRPVCPYLFKSCPKIPPAVIKMECRAKGIDPNDIKHRYRNPFQEKKCFCLPGFYPRGPICTNSAATVIGSLLVVIPALLLSNIHT